jgi:hypothetical protein
MPAVVVKGFKERASDTRRPEMAKSIEREKEEKVTEPFNASSGSIVVQEESL